MAALSWSASGDKKYQAGVDRGVFYDPNNNNVGVAWNGLISVDLMMENLTAVPIHIDGIKRGDKISPGDVSGGLKAYTYPDEFLPCSGFGEYAEGIYADAQKPIPFGMSYRTLLGDDIVGDNLGYLIHILYNVSAVPDVRQYHTLESNVAPVNFSWRLYLTPGTIDGNPYRPAAHFIIDSTKVLPQVLSYLEDLLYGTELTEPSLPSVETLLLTTDVTIGDNGDGTWYALGENFLVYMNDADSFSVEGADTTFLDADTYEIDSTF